MDDDVCNIKSYAEARLCGGKVMWRQGLCGCQWRVT